MAFPTGLEYIDSGNVGRLTFFDAFRQQHVDPLIGARNLGCALRVRFFECSDRIEVADPFAHQPPDVDAGDAGQCLDPIVDDCGLDRKTSDAADAENDVG